MLEKRVKKVDRTKIKKEDLNFRFKLSKKEMENLVKIKSCENFTSSNKQNKVKSEKKNEKNEYKKFLKQKFIEFNNNGKINIVFFCDAFYPIIDGVIKVMDNYMTRLSKKFNVIACVPKHNGRTPKSDKYVVLGASSIYIKSINYDLAMPDFDPDFQSILKHLRIDIIHSHSPFYMGGYAVKIAKKYKIPIVTTFHSQYKRDFYQATKNDFLTKILLSNVMRRFNQSTEVWTMHQKILNTLLSYGFKGKYYLMPNATDMEYPSNHIEMINKVNSTYNLNSVENVLLFVGRLVETKNVLFIIDSLKVLKEKGFPFKMFFVGSGPAEKKMKLKIAENGLENDIILTGKIMDNDIFQGMYLRADLFVFPSMYDASSIVQIESAINKTPAIFLEESVTSGDVKDNVNGFLSKNSIQDFSNKLMEVLSDKDKLKQVSEQCYIDCGVSWDSIIKRAEERYIYLIKQNKEKLAKLKLDKLSKQNKKHKN